MRAKVHYQQVQLADVIRNRALSLTASVYDLPIADIAQPTRRSPKASAARQVAIYLAYTMLGTFSFADLGALFGRSASTTRHAVRAVEERREDPRLDQTLTWLEGVLRNALEIAR